MSISFNFGSKSIEQLNHCLYQVYKHLSSNPNGFTVRKVIFGNHKVLKVTSSHDELYIWDPFNSAQLKLLQSLVPLLLLWQHSTHHAFLKMSLMCWLRIAVDCFLASLFPSSWNLGSIQSAELAALQVEGGKFLARKPSWSSQREASCFCSILVVLMVLGFRSLEDDC
ncbi:hypothetical protein MKX01_031929 [Papaver californicum]|nr:hypothetical protein MKX01_031929 [Papaver californicum]